MLRRDRGGVKEVRAGEANASSFRSLIQGRPYLPHPRRALFGPRRTHNDRWLCRLVQLPRLCWIGKICQLFLGVRLRIYGRFLLRIAETEAGYVEEAQEVRGPPHPLRPLTVQVYAVRAHHAHLLGEVHLGYGLLELSRQGLEEVGFLYRVAGHEVTAGAFEGLQHLSPFRNPRETKWRALGPAIGCSPSQLKQM